MDCIGMYFHGSERGLADMAGQLRDYRQDYLWRPTILALPTDNIGGDRYDLTTWSREDRAEHAFDKKDPLAEFTDEQIEAGDFELP